MGLLANELAGRKSAPAMLAHLAEDLQWWVIYALTFDMSSGLTAAKRLARRPLDGRVRAPVR
jgi:hypothetical protein